MTTIDLYKVAIAFVGVALFVGGCQSKPMTYERARRIMVEQYGESRIALYEAERTEAADLFAGKWQRGEMTLQQSSDAFNRYQLGHAAALEASSPRPFTCTTTNWPIVTTQCR